MQKFRCGSIICNFTLLVFYMRWMNEYTDYNDEEEREHLTNMEEVFII